MDQQTLWKRYCDHVRFYPEVGLSLDISRMRFPDGYLKSMDARMASAFQAMDALERGEIVNPDEGRMVGHYWLRTPELAPDEKTKKEILAVNDKIRRFAKDVHEKKIRPEKADAFRHVIIVGIGGSALGPQLVSDALGTQHDRMKIWFCDNTDPDGIHRLIRISPFDSSGRRHTSLPSTSQAIRPNDGKYAYTRCPSTTGVAATGLLVR